jgi:ribonuclease T1
MTGIILLAGVLFYNQSESSQDAKGVQTKSYPEIHLPQSSKPAPTKVLLKDRLVSVPAYVYDMLEFVEENGVAPENFVGGRIFQNREKRLPQKMEGQKKIIYREWDVHPKDPIKNRGAERLITGDDKSAYYTKDHYSTFLKLK